jgi:hypothetical protein
LVCLVCLVCVLMLGRLSMPPAAQSVAGAFESEYVGMVDDAVDHGVRNSRHMRP